MNDKTMSSARNTHMTAEMPMHAPPRVLSGTAESIYPVRGGYFDIVSDGGMDPRGKPCAAPAGFVPAEEPESFDGHDYEGFAGGCKRMGCSQPSRECLQQSAEEVDFLLEDLPPVEGLDAILAEYEKTYGRTPDAAMAATVGKVKNMLLMWWASHREAIATALQAAPPAPQGEKVYAALPEPSGDNGYGDHLWDAESMRDFADATAALRAISAPAPAGVAVPWDNFPSYLIDHCEGDTITEEGLQHALAAMLANPQYAAAPAQAKVSQDHFAPAQEHATHLAGQPPIEALLDAVQTTFDKLQDQLDAAGAMKKGRVQAYVSLLRDAFVQFVAAAPQAPATPAVDAREDAERYRWLRENRFGIQPAHMDGPAHPQLQSFSYDLWADKPETHNPSGLDAAIDTARAAQGGAA